jgi:hypothetical protein
VSGKILEFFTAIIFNSLFSGAIFHQFRTKSIKILAATPGELLEINMIKRIVTQFPSIQGSEINFLSANALSARRRDT